jgi:hypothetical protein
MAFRDAPSGVRPSLNQDDDTRIAQPSAVAYLVTPPYGPRLAADTRRIAHSKTR